MLLPCIRASYLSIEPNRYTKSNISGKTKVSVFKTQASLSTEYSSSLTKRKYSKDNVVEGSANLEGETTQLSEICYYHTRSGRSIK